MTLLIRNVRIIGGVRDFPDQSDIFIQNDKISAIGKFPSKKADEIIDGQGMYCTPGFIDVNTDSDHYLTLFDNPDQSDFLKQGVTTIMGGMCGASLAPLLYGSLESVRKWGDVRCVNVGWHSLEELLTVLDARHLGVNFGTLIGHSTIRRALVGESNRSLTKNEMKIFIATLERALKEGGFGLSTGLGYVHGKETSYAELKTLATVTEKMHGIYATHLRDMGDGLEASIDETLKLQKETKIRTLISHLMPLMGLEKSYTATLDALSNLSPSRDVYFDVYPFDMSVVPVYTLLPQWVQSGNIETMTAELEDPWKRKRIVKELPEIAGDDFVVASAPQNELLIGRTMRSLMEIYTTHSSQEALMKFMRATSLRAVVFYRNIDSSLIYRALSHPRSLIATNAASVRESHLISMLKPERAVRTFPKYLDMMRTSGDVAFEDAIKKITAIPAHLFGIRDRGEIKEGNFADCVGFTVRDGESSPLEIRLVVVNGTIAVKNGSLTGKSKGKVLRHIS
ncbi:MAG: hypothetical protein NUV53_01700 [Patescibacteria group bacterium]|nr:hypothetical protein [Patescibacteria group bacterium]